MNDILKMYKEDLLRAILEFGIGNSEVDAKDLLADVGGEQRLFGQATLEKEKLIRRKGERIILTPSGREAAEKIYAKHRFIEEYFSEVFNETNVHFLAHALEHCVSDSLLAKMQDELASMSGTLNLSRAWLVNLASARIWNKFIPEMHLIEEYSMYTQSIFMSLIEGDHGGCGNA